MTDLKATIRIMNADAYVDAEEAAENICDALAETFSTPPKEITIHILIEDEDGRPIAERRIVGADQ